jgi:hypothetical protein
MCVGLTPAGNGRTNFPGAKLSRQFDDARKPLAVSKLDWSGEARRDGMAVALGHSGNICIYFYIGLEVKMHKIHQKKL